MGEDERRLCSIRNTGLKRAAIVEQDPESDYRPLIDGVGGLHWNLTVAEGTSLIFPISVGDIVNAVIATASLNHQIDPQ